MPLKKRNFQDPDSTQNPPLVRVDTIKLGDATIVKQTFQPGWKWSKHMKPLAGTDTCQMHHFGVYVSGRMRVRDASGQEMDFGPGDVVDIPPGHDGWVVGDEPAVFYGFVHTP